MNELSAKATTSATGAILALDERRPIMASGTATKDNTNRSIGIAMFNQSTSIGTFRTTCCLAATPQRTTRGNGSVKKKAVVAVPLANHGESRGTSADGAA